MKFEIYRDQAGEYRWRLVAPGSQVVTGSDAGYARREGARRAVATLQTAILAARIVDVG